MTGKQASITLKDVDLESRAVTEAHLVARSKERFLELAANWWDNYGTNYNPFREFHAEMSNNEEESK